MNSSSMCHLHWAVSSLQSFLRPFLGSSGSFRLSVYGSCCLSFGWGARGCTWDLRYVLAGFGCHSDFLARRVLLFCYHVHPAGFSFTSGFLKALCPTRWMEILKCGFSLAPGREGHPELRRGGLPATCPRCLLHAFLQLLGSVEWKSTWQSKSMAVWLNTFAPQGPLLAREVFNH